MEKLFQGRFVLCPGKKFQVNLLIVQMYSFVLLLKWLTLRTLLCVIKKTKEQNQKPNKKNPNANIY